MIVVDETGVSIDTFEDILAEVQTDFRTQFGASVATENTSSMGQFQRLLSLREHQIQQAIQRTYQQNDARVAEGVHQDQRNADLGVTRLAAAYAEVLGTATGTPSTNIPNGTTLSVGGVLFDVADGPYVIGGGGTVSGVKLVAQALGAVDVTLLGAWTIVDVTSGFDSFDDDSQPIAGRLTETDTEYRVRAEEARFRRASGGLDAIEAAVLDVEGVTYARAWHNVDTDPVDADGIPLHAINVVAVGGLDAEVAQAIFDSGPPGHLFYGTDVTVQISSGPAAQDVSFDRVADVTMWARVTLTTSTSEGETPDDLATVVSGLLVTYAADNWTIGTDALSHQLSGALAGISGVDAILVELSIDDGTGDPYSTAKRAISIRQQAKLTAARITVIEN